MLRDLIDRPETVPIVWVVHPVTGARLFRLPVELPDGWCVTADGELQSGDAAEGAVAPGGAAVAAPAELPTRTPCASAGTADGLDGIVVRHASGGCSTLTFKSYDPGRRMLQGETPDFVWFDEEPPEDIYTVGKTRVNATGGTVWLTFTPLLGMSAVVRSFQGAAGDPF